MGAELAIYNEKEENREIGRAPSGIGSIKFNKEGCYDN